MHFWKLLVLVQVLVFAFFFVVGEKDAPEEEVMELRQTVPPREAAMSVAEQAPTANPSPEPTTVPTEAPEAAPTAAPAAAAAARPAPAAVAPAAVVPAASAEPAAPSPAAQPAATGRVSSPCLRIEGQSNRVIENLDIGPCGSDHGILVYQSQNITIRNVRIRGTQTGITALESSGVHISNSEISNTTRQLVIFDKSSQSSVRGVTGFWTSGGWDGLSAYMSQDILMEGNHVSGGREPSGCALIADGPAPNQRVTIRGNTVRNFTNCGIGVANGSGHVVEANDIAGYTNRGIYVWDQYGPFNDCRDIIVRNNQVTVDGNGPFWEQGNCAGVTLLGNSW